jgi:cell division protein FtsB
VLVIVLFAILVSYVNPVVNFFDAWRDSRTERSQLADLSRERANVAQRAVALKDSHAASQEARRLGMVAPGERSYVITGLHRN